MVKKSRNLLVWQQKQNKQRKTRTKKSSIKGIMIQIQEQQQQQSIQDDVNETQKVQIQQSSSRKSQQSLQLHQNDQEQHQKSQSITNKNPIFMQELRGQIYNIKQILYSDENRFAKSTSTSRQSQKSSIIKFLVSQKIEIKQMTSLLYIYGSPGTGKTYLIKSILSQLNLSTKTKWINSLSILKGAKSKINDEVMMQQKIILVIDQFDQMQYELNNKIFLQFFKKYLEKIFSKEYLPNRRLIKCILISNKSYESINYQYIHEMQRMLQCSAIIQISFYPYTVQNIFEIIMHKINIIKDVFDIYFEIGISMQIQINRIYNKTQDIRKIIATLIHKYQLYQLSKLSGDSRQGLSSQMKEVQEEIIQLSSEASFIKAMPQNQKKIFLNLVKTFWDKSQKDKHLLTKDAYQQGSKHSIQKPIMDIWLKQWQQLGLLKTVIYKKTRQTLSRQFYLKINISKYYYQKYINDDDY